MGFLSICTQFGPRTYLFSALFTGLTLLFIRAYLRGADPRRGYWLVPMFALWANVHIEFIYGLFFLGLATFDRWLRRFHPGTKTNRSWKPLALLTALCLGATAMNPFGVRLHAMILRMMGPYTANDLVSEMQANTFRSPIDYLILLLFGSAVFTLAQRRDRDVYSWGALVASAYMGFHSQRISWLLSFVALDILGDHALFSGGGEAGHAPRLFRLSLPAVVGVTIVVFTAFLVQTRERLAPRALFPYAAASSRASGLSRVPLQRLELGRVFPIPVARHPRQHRWTRSHLRRRSPGLDAEHLARKAGVEDRPRPRPSRVRHRQRAHGAFAASSIRRAIQEGIRRQNTSSCAKQTDMLTAIALLETGSI